MVRSFFTLLFLFGTLFAWTLEDSFKVKTYHGIKVSPDANHVLFIMKDYSLEKNANDWNLKLYISDCQGKNKRIFSHKNVLFAEWSPDGKSIAFVAKEAEKKGSLWLLPFEGGEAEQVLDQKKEIVAFSFSPDSSKIALLLQEEENQDQIKRREEKRDVLIVDEHRKNSHLWILDLQTKNLEQLTNGAFTIGTGLGGEEFDWSPDGTEIAFPRMSKPGANFWGEARLWTVNIKTKELNEVQTDSFAIIPKYSPDGKWIAYVRGELPFHWNSNFDIALYDREKKVPKNLALTINRDFGTTHALVGWSKDSSALYAIESLKTKSQLYEIPIDETPCKSVNLGDGFVHDLTLNAGLTYFGYVLEGTSLPPEIFVKEISSTPLQITHLNETLPLHTLGKTEVFTYPSFDGLEIEALMTYPENYETGKKFPLLLVIHGGPASLYQEKFIGGPNPYPIATFASEGYGILRCNIRGSNGYGKEFRIKNFKDWGGKDYNDLMEGVNLMITKGADPDRLGVMGWSYGGYMTGWIITQTDRFKAASCGAGVYNLISMFGTTDIPQFMSENFGEPYWEDEAIYLERSAIHHIKNVKTPTLIQHGVADERVPLAQSYELYTALKMRNVPVKFEIYPRSGHSIKEPKLLFELGNSNLQWFNRYVKNLKN